jgi:hypothetical protein
MPSRSLDGPTPPWVGEPAEEVKASKRGFKGFEILRDSRIIDLRWNRKPVSRPRRSCTVIGAQNKLR